MKELKPIFGTCTPSIVEDVLTLVGIVPKSNPRGWRQTQRDEAYDYAIRLHLWASGNRFVRLPPKPSFL